LKSILREPHAHHLESLKKIFSGLWSLEDYETDPSVKEIVKKAISEPHRFVVKP